MRSRLALDATVDLLPNVGRRNGTLRGGRERRVRVTREPPVRRLDVLARTEPPPGEVGARAKRRLPVGVARSHHEVRGPVEGVPHLDERIRVALAQADVERFLERARSTFAELVRDVARVERSSGG